MNHRPGRIVMLVQNGVNGDSRVQKEAASAAAAGWEVHLLGRSPDKHRHEWRLGDATVWLLPMQTVLTRRPHEFRPAWLRDPLAYPHGPLEAYRRRQLEVRRIELRQAGARYEAEADDLSPAARLLRRAGLKARRAALRLRRAWVRLRVRRTKLLRERRRTMTSLLDRATTRLWSLAPGGPSWRRFDPGLWEIELAFGPVLDELEPDLIHANDFQMLGVGARAKVRARAAGRDVKLVWDAHEFLPGIRPWVPHPRWLPAQVAHEREYAPAADAVVTVSAPLAELLRERHSLAEQPTVVLNAPEFDATGEPVPSLRGLCGIGPDVPLMVYSGTAALQRGLDVMITALPSLEGVHIAFVVSRPDSAYVRELLALAEDYGVADRLHLVPYVSHQLVAPFLSEADVGVIPLRHYLNHEIALITKFFEYSHARLPMVVSDVKAMGEMVTATGQGEVFKAEDTESFVQAVKAVLTAPDAYRAAYDDPDLLAEWTWQAQADRLCGVYRRLLGEGGDR
jgi:glycosyltransferase involved in cell wall biosynthesis